MRKITELAKHYFDNNIKKKLGNTEINVIDGRTGLFLFDNLIAYKEHSTGKIYFRLHGWNSVTTRERLQAVGVKVYTKNFIPYYLGEQIENNLNWIEA